MEKTRMNRSKAFEKPLLFAVIILHILVSAVIGFNKQYLFTDEVYTYGLANSEEYSFIDPGKNPTLLNWTDGEFFKTYLQYDESTPFSFHAAFVNQANDVHPPLYYCLIHIVSFFLRNMGYSPIPGIVLNLLCIPFIDLLLYYIAKYFLGGNQGGALAVVVLWAFSASGLSNVIFIRMYWLMTLEILAVVAFHIWTIQNKWVELVPVTEKITPTRRLRCVTLYVMLVLLVACGGLTHYYFYFFTAILGLCVCIYLLSCEKIRLLLAYGSALWLGVFLALAIFPATYQHIFGYRGDYTTKHIGGFSAEKFRSYWGFIDQSLLGGCFWILLVICVIAILWHIVKPAVHSCSFEKGSFCVKFCFRHTMWDKSFSLYVTPQKWLLAFVVIAVAGFCYVAIQGSDITSSRYIYPIFPLLALFLVVLLQKALFNIRGKSAILCVAALALPILSIKAYGIDWLYADFDRKNPNVEKLTGMDCVIICKDDAWVNVLQAINVYVNMDEVRCVYASDIGNIGDVVAERNTDDPLCIAFYSNAMYSEDERLAYLDEILEKTPYEQYIKVYDYNTVIYQLS